MDQQQLTLASALGDFFKSGWATAGLISLVAIFFFRLWLTEARARLAETKERATAAERNNEVIKGFTEAVAELQDRIQQSPAPQPRRRS